MNRREDLIAVLGTTPLRRVLLCAALVSVALVLQTSVLSFVAWDGVTPDLVLLIVMAGGFARGPSFGLVLGFWAGLLCDLAPPSDHVAGRWALALMVVGYVAGRVRRDVRPTLVSTLATVAACSFAGSSVFAVSGLMLGDAAGSIPDMLRVVLIGVVLDTFVAGLIVPFVLRALQPVPARRSVGAYA